MHAHTTYASPAEVERAFFPALVAHGVLGIRDPASRFSVQQTARWRSLMARNQLLGPRLEALGRVLDANPSTVGTIVLRNEKEAAAAAERLAREGYEFAKPYNDLAPQVYRAFVREPGATGSSSPVIYRSRSTRRRQRR